MDWSPENDESEIHELREQLLELVDIVKRQDATIKTLQHNVRFYDQQTQALRGALIDSGLLTPEEIEQNRLMFLSQHERWEAQQEARAGSAASESEESNGT